MRALDRYVVVGLAALVALVSFVSVAQAYFHTGTNGVQHGLLDSTPTAFTAPIAGGLAYAAVRHYYDDHVSWTEQCAQERLSYAECTGNWGTAPCQKRSVNAVYLQMNRHWVRKSGCPGTIHP